MDSIGIAVLSESGEKPYSAGKNPGGFVISRRIAEILSQTMVRALDVGSLMGRLL